MKEFIINENEAGQSIVRRIIMIPNLGLETVHSLHLILEEESNEYQSYWQVVKVV